MPSASVPRGLSFARLPLFGSFTQKDVTLALLLDAKESKISAIAKVFADILQVILYLL